MPGGAEPSSVQWAFRVLRCVLIGVIAWRILRTILSIVYRVHEYYQQVASSQRAAQSELRLDLKRRSADFDPSDYGWAKDARLSSRRSIIAERPPPMWARVWPWRMARRGEASV